MLPILEGRPFAAVWAGWTSSLSFAPGLLDAVRSSEPPTLEFFKHLPLSPEARRGWGIYVLVLEKLNRTPLIYVGSGTGTGTGAIRGVSARLAIYERLDTSKFPIYVQEAIKGGFEIVHIGLLLWGPVPSAADPDLDI
jgi:hypothetical protein